MVKPLRSKKHAVHTSLQRPHKVNICKGPTDIKAMYWLQCPEVTNLEITVDHILPYYMWAFQTRSQKAGRDGGRREAAVEGWREGVIHGLHPSEFLSLQAGD